MHSTSAQVHFSEKDSQQSAQPGVLDGPAVAVCVQAGSAASVPARTQPLSVLGGQVKLLGGSGNEVDPVTSRAAGHGGQE